MGEPLLYARERELRLADILDLINDDGLKRTGRRARDMEVLVLRVSSRDGRARRIAPLALGECLYLDARDFEAIRQGDTLPRVGEAVRDLLTLRREKAATTRCGRSTG